MKVSYDIEENNEEFIWIADRANRDNTPTITNRAEEVVEQLVTQGLLPQGKKLYYTDTDGRIDEILHDLGQFTDFSPGSPLIDQM